MLPQPTIPLNYALPVLQALQNKGYSLQQLFREAGIAAPTKQVNSMRVELPALEFTRLYGIAFRLLEAETSQRTDQSRMGKDVVDMMCYCVITCADLAEAIERVIAFNRMIGPLGSTLELQRDGIRARLLMDLHRNSCDTASLLVCLAAMNVLHQLFSWLIGQPLKLQEVAVKYPVPGDYLPMTESLGIPLQYDQTCDALSFSVHYLAQPVVRSYAELQRIIDYFPFDISYSGLAGGTLSERIRMLLLSTLQQQRPLPSSEAVAQLFHISPATLRRRLREEAAHYSDIRVSCQREYAEHLLRHTGYAVQDIAIQLGFADDRAFRRAFRQWNGVSPSKFRGKE